LLRCNKELDYFSVIVAKRLTMKYNAHNSNFYEEGDEVKKWIGLGLVLALLVTSAALGKVTTAYAMTPFSLASYAMSTYAAIEEEAAFWDEHVFELSLEQKKALEKIFRLIPELRELSEQNGIDGYNDPDNNTWGVWLRSEEPEGEGLHLMTQAWLDFDASTGELTYYDFNNLAWASEETPSEQLAVRKADAFIKEIMGDRIKLHPLGANGEGGFSWVHEDGNKTSFSFTRVDYCPLINGIPVTDYEYSVGVDIFGNIVRFSRYPFGDWSLDYSLFIHPDQAVLSPTDAKRIMEREKTMELAYLLGYSYYDRNLPWLVYFDNGPTAIDAVTGKNPYWYDNFAVTKQSLTLSGQGNKMTARNQQEAESFLVSFLGADMSDMTSDGADRYEDSAYYYQWYNDIDWEQPDAFDTWRSYSVTTDAYTGEVIGFHSYNSKDWDNPAIITEKEAETIALAFLKTVLPKENIELLQYSYPDSFSIVPDWADPDLVDFDDQTQNDAWFSFLTAHQGIPVFGEQHYSVSVNLATGKVYSYSGGGYKMPVDWPDATLAVSPERAKNEFMKNTQLQLVYIWPDWFGQKAPAPMLVYTTAPNDNWFFIDALTGNAVYIDD